jgi:hypothetical protein
VVAHPVTETYEGLSDVESESLKATVA